MNQPPTITAIYGSPRKDGNTDLLLKSFLKGIEENGRQQALEIYLRDLDFGPCIECGGCDKTGRCVLKDDMSTVYTQLLKSDIVVLAAPVFFYSLNAQAKAMIDRCQCLWVAKYVLGMNTGSERVGKGRGVYLGTSGSKGRKNFDGIFLTLRYFFDVIDVDFSHHLTYRQIDSKGAISKHPDILQEAFRLGQSMLGLKDE